MPRFIPQPSYERDERRLVKYYKDAFKKIVYQLGSITNGIEAAQAVSLLNQIAFILRELDGNTRQWADDVVAHAYRDGQATALVELGEARTLAEAVAGVSFSLLARQQVEALVNDTYNDLLMATQNTERKVKQLVRSVVGDTLRVKAIEQLGRRTTRNEIIDKLTKAGLSKKLESEAWVGIVDKAGRRWNLSTYAEMVVRTKLQQAHVEGRREELTERGLDLAVVSSHGAKDACRSYEGMVISMNGLTPSYLTYNELRDSGKIFHPNCQHTVHALRDFDLLPTALKDKHNRKMTELDQ
ncbi:Phage minor capsid protein 2 [Desulfotomaculum arcticum]|uniref:Phage minor capsid protein 2 n=1 Tax=Desulfotruncus arcticus DSM 17038 TaxID=1121424 RepID=A0A1I2YBS5_9FIRM|nr:phage minor capsid protein [Desulfotruncus arcticus]SFH23140.1 Phage minor capsid protein 2 [Desulfotomaculum arcticum] [Desulfotruncus arcticus DSM 17038]